MRSLPTRPSPRWLLALVALLSLTGCLDILEEIWLQPDGSARVVVELRVAQSFLGLAEAQAKELAADLRRQALAAQEELKKDPDVVKVEVRDGETDGRYFVAYDLTVKDATRLAELQQKVLSGTSAAKVGASGGQVLPFQISKPEYGVYVFEQKLGQAGQEPGADVGSAVAQALGRGAATAMLGESALIVRVHGPNVLETNGTLDEAKETAEWKYRLADLAVPSGPPHELHARVRVSPPLWVWGPIVGVPLLLVWLMFAAARRRGTRTHSLM